MTQACSNIYLVHTFTTQLRNSSFPLLLNFLPQGSFDMALLSRGVLPLRDDACLLEYFCIYFSNNSLIYLDSTTTIIPLNYLQEGSVDMALL